MGGGPDWKWQQKPRALPELATTYRFGLRVSNFSISLTSLRFSEVVLSYHIAFVSVFLSSCLNCDFLAINHLRFSGHVQSEE